MSGGCIPEPCGLVRATGEDGLAVGAERHGMDLVLMTYSSQEIVHLAEPAAYRRLDDPLLRGGRGVALDSFQGFRQPEQPMVDFPLLQRAMPRSWYKFPRRCWDSIRSLRSSAARRRFFSARPKFASASWGARSRDRTAWSREWVTSTNAMMTVARIARIAAAVEPMVPASQGFRLHQSQPRSHVPAGRA